MRAGKACQLKDWILLPKPRLMKAGEGVLDLASITRISLSEGSAETMRAAEAIRSAGSELAGMTWPIRKGAGRGSARGGILLKLDAKAAPAQGYRLVVGRANITLTAADAAGLFHGAMTLKQLLRQSDGWLPVMDIKDHPDFKVRGVMIDISRDKVPSMATLYALVDRFAEWKLNHLELYTEHTFAYSRHCEVWKDASPMTPQEIRKLDAYCHERFIELVPNQNTFGHMDRWLKHDAYRDLAECPDGFDTPWGAHRTAPNCLNPEDPRSLTLMAGLFDELLPNFTSRKFNVGCDETWDLGQGRCKAVCEQRGKGRVYLDYLLKIAELVRQRGRILHVWGDIIIGHPELVAEIPRDVVVLEWGYEANHPFDEHGARFAASGIPFYVCPGTSSWNSLSGRTQNGLENLTRAAESGLKHGAAGYLNTDWGDGGHWQYLPVSYLGFAAGAALSWSVKANRAQDWRRTLDVHVFEDKAGVMGGLAYDLGNTYLRTGHQIGNGSILNTLLKTPWSQSLPEGVTEATLANTKGWVDGVMSRLPQARMTCRDGKLIAREFSNTARMLHHACDRGILMRRGGTGNPEFRAQLASSMRDILESHRSLWLARNRPGGLADSLKAMEQRLAEYEDKGAIT